MQKVFRLRVNYICHVVIVLKAPHKFMVGVYLVQNVMCLSECGIRQGDCLSSTLFSLCAAVFLRELLIEGLLNSVYAFMYVDDLMLVFPTEHNFDLVEEIIDSMELFRFLSCRRLLLFMVYP